MGLFDFFRRKRDKAGLPVGSGSMPYAAASWTSLKYRKMVHEAYIKNVIGYRCVEIGASLFSQPEWYALNNRNNELADDHPLIQTINRPNPFQSGVQYRFAWRACYRLAGNVYQLMVTGIPGTKAELYILPPEYMSIELDSRGQRVAYKYDDGVNKLSWPIDPQTGESEILHTAKYHPTDQLHGVGDLVPAIRSIDTFNSVVDYTKTLLDNQGNPPGIFNVKDDDTAKLDDSQLEDFKKAVLKHFSGPKNAGKPIVAVNTEYKALAWTPRDMEYAKAKESVARDVCIAFAVPFVLLNMTDSTFANMDTARASFFEDQILPELHLLRDGWNNWLAPRFGKNIKLSFDTDDLPFMAPRLQLKMQTATMMKNMGVFTGNEIREFLGWDQRPELEQLPGQSTDGQQQIEDQTQQDEQKALPAPDIAEMLRLGFEKALVIDGEFTETEPAGEEVPKVNSETMEPSADEA